MSDLRRDFHNMIEAMGRVSLLAHLRDKVIEAQQTDRSRCGNCFFWMKSRECPREHNVNGYMRGPSSGDPACGKLQLEQWVIDLKMRRIAEAIAFADEHDLPLPFASCAVSAANHMGDRT